ncbi:MAG: hypothetical protein RL701_1235 [Pseudomonadota bacterium]|jgi:signal transduction histidine kinase
MKVRTRLLLLGVAAPALGLAAALSGADYLFRRHMLASVDRELLARAAVESVGAFDDPTVAVHLHLGRATFPRGFVELDPRGAMYDARGAAASDPPDEPPIAQGPFDMAQADRPRLWTAGDRRELAVALRAPNGTPYLLRLSCSLGPVQQTLDAYVRTTTILLAAVLVALLILWSWLARALSRRLEYITARLPQGDDVPMWREHEPQAHDEIAELDRALAAAFARLHRAKAVQGEFIARAAHELKTPLGIMAAEMDLALARQRSPDELQRALLGSRGEVKRLAELSSRLLDLTAAQGSELDFRPVDLVRTIYESLDYLGATLEEAGVRVRVDAPTEQMAHADPLLVRQAIENLLANALRYSPRTGTVALSVSAGDMRVCLDIRDDGPGIPANEHERVFEPFVRGANAHGVGSGLGLAIVRAITVRLKGTVEVIPSERGAHFRLCLPATV